MKKNIYRFEKVVPIYTGGNIYCFFGEVDGVYFIACDSMYDVTLVNETPFNEDGTVNEDVWFAEWQEDHLVRYLDCETEGLVFFKQMLTWILAQKEYIEGGNYNNGDMEDELRDVKERLGSNEIEKETIHVELNTDELYILSAALFNNLVDLKGTEGYKEWKHDLKTMKKKIDDYAERLRRAK